MIRSSGIVQHVLLVLLRNLLKTTGTRHVKRSCCVRRTTACHNRDAFDSHCLSALGSCPEKATIKLWLPCAVNHSLHSGTCVTKPSASWYHQHASLTSRTTSHTKIKSTAKNCPYFCFQLPLTTPFIFGGSSTIWRRTRRQLRLRTAAAAAFRWWRGRI